MSDFSSPLDLSWREYYTAKGEAYERLVWVWNEDIGQWHTTVLPKHYLGIDGWTLEDRPRRWVPFMELAYTW